jgi:hypothetical protein
MAGSPRIEDLLAEARYHRHRYHLYRAKMYGLRPTTLARLRGSSGSTSALRPASAEPTRRARRTTATDRPPRPTHARGDSRAATRYCAPDATRGDVGAGGGRWTQSALVAHLCGWDPGLRRPALRRQRAKAHRRPRGRSWRAASRRAWRSSRPARRDAGTAPASLGASRANDRPVHASTAR